MFFEICRIDRMLRPYQQNAKENIFDEWDECNHIMFQMPTGTGKTRLFTSIISDIKAWSVINSIDVKILIIAHRIELIEQISGSLDKYKISHGIIVGGKERSLGHQIQVASIQTIMHRTNFDLASSLNANFIIIDEAHHSTANSYKKLWQMYPNAKILGVTATPWRMNHLGFRSIYDRIIISQPIQTFINEGWLAPYCYFSINENSFVKQEINDINEFDIDGDYKTSALERVMDKSKIRANLLNSYLKFAKGKKGIIYSISRKHSDHICEEYRKAGIRIVRIDSETPKDERNLYVQRFRDGLIDIIVNVDIFSEGFDCPDIEFIQLARPTRSLVKYLQQVGRGLRPIAGKGKCLILDNVGAHLEFGLPNSDRDWEEEFSGTAQSPKRKSSIHNIEKEIEYTEKTFDEGSDELLLIEDLNGPSTPSVSESPIPQWDAADDDLLKVLYVDRKCPICLIATVFRKEESLISDRISMLNLQQE